MVEKYIIDKTDIHNLIMGKELDLPQGCKARAFCVEVLGNLTNGDMVLATGMFSVVKELNDGIMVYVKPKGVFGQVLEYPKDWWDAPYMQSEEE